MTAVTRRRSRLRRALVYLTAAAVVTLVAAVVLLVFDIYLHRRVQYDAGFNIWGYRGDVVGKKRPGERRIIVLGGSTAFGYGLHSNESWPYYLERRLARERERGRLAAPPADVVNLGIPTDSARTFVATLNDYEYLHADVAMFYEGYNDLGLNVNPPKNPLNPTVTHYMEWRHQSPIFRWTGYFPIFPLVISEKASLLLHRGGTPSATGDVVFRPDLATRATAATMDAAAHIGAMLERRLGELTDVTVQTSQTIEHGCGRWSEYCGAIEEAVQHALAHHQRVAVITQPYVSDLHVNQQRALAGMLRDRFGSDPRVRYVNLGTLVDLRDPSIAYDGIHLVAPANDRVAEALVPTVVDLMTP